MRSWKSLTAKDAKVISSCLCRAEALKIAKLAVTESSPEKNADCDPVP